MYCPNCGALNDEGAKFCANCGTTLGSTPVAGEPGPVHHQQPIPQASPVNYQPSVYQAPNYQTSGSSGMGGFGQGNSMLKNIGIGCLIAIAIFFFVGISCTRACLGHRRGSIIRRY